MRDQANSIEYVLESYICHCQQSSSSVERRNNLKVYKSQVAAEMRQTRDVIVLNSADATDATALCPQPCSLAFFPTIASSFHRLSRPQTIMTSLTVQLPGSRRCLVSDWRPLDEA